MSRMKTVKLNNDQNRGFTLVELIVILVLLMILITLSIGGIFAWQDWTRFKQENTGAENIFYAAQNQLNELNANGMMDDTVYSVLESLPPGHILGSPSNSNFFSGDTIAYDSDGGNKLYYNWYTLDDLDGYVWKNLNHQNTDDISDPDKVSNYQGTIYYLSADKGDFDRYLSGELYSMPNKSDTVLLFDIITPYIADKSVLNGAIWLEFSPEAAQVFSVCYSDRVNSFSHNNGNQDAESNSAVASVLDRRESTRRDLLIGYYATDSMSIPLVGKSKGVTTGLELRNDETLSLVINAGSSIDESITYDVTLYKGNDNEINNRLMSFSFNASDIPIFSGVGGEAGLQNAENAGRNPVTVQAKFYNGVYKSSTPVDIKLPVWKDQEISDGENVWEIHIVFDAADVQAQSVLYADRAHPDESFINTYSFYGFGFTMNTINRICCGVSARRGSELVGEENVTNSESPTFGNVESDGGEKVYIIKNARHLYNVRFETDYKAVTYERTFKVVNDIDWNEFVNNPKTNDGCDYFLNSYEAGGNAEGINFEGLDYSINNVENVLANDIDATDTRNYRFPGFRTLAVGDTFTAIKDENSNDDENENIEVYTISNLKIAYSANVLYGVYDAQLRDFWRGAYSISDYGTYTGEVANHPVLGFAMKGECPVGLFAENSGTIEYLTLNHHQVIGMEMLKDYRNNSGAKTLVYTNMAGGFVGNNLGTIRGLTLRNVNNLQDTDTVRNEPTQNYSHVNGKTDVGGIVGRQSWVYNTYEGSSVELADLSNYAKVTGMEKVGGIVGNAYVIRTNHSKVTVDGNIRARLPYYNDGYTNLFGEYDSNLNLTNQSSLKTFTGQNVRMADHITIKNCQNRGLVSGDELIHENNLVYYGGTYNNKSSNELYRCSFIGGIAGVTIDGIFMDSRSNAYSDYSSDVNRVNLENCSSYRLYSSTELESIESSDGAGMFPEGEIRDMLEHDYYVGGLVGYSRLTTYKNCTNASVDAVTEYTEGETTIKYKPFVFGRSYVGGLFGCYDTSFISGESILDDGYSAVNYINTIGVMHVGGFAGGVGIGDDSRQGFYLNYPSCNEGSQVSQVQGQDTIVVSNICNKSVVLGVRREKLDYAKDTGLVYLQDRDINLGVKDKDNRVLTNMPDSCIGGVIGCMRFISSNLNNIQSSGTKDYAFELIGINASYSEADYDKCMAADEYSYYGGNVVGGLFGKHIGQVALNSESGTFNTVSAVVYGENSVGGCVAGTNKDSKNLNNVKIQDSKIIGRDMVGGLSGKNMSAYITGRECGNYCVYGRYSVGGAVGCSYNRGMDVYITAEHNDGVEVKGKAYVGGFAGTSLPSGGSYTGRLEKVSVEADYFAGGLIGAIYGNSTDGKIYNMSNVTVKNSNLTVEAEKAFAGGIIGLYAYHNGLKISESSADSEIVAEDIVEADDIFKSVTGADADTCYLIKLVDDMSDSNSAAAAVVASETATSGNWGLNPNLSGITLSPATVTLKKEVFLSSNTNKVTAPIFAGGVFGYVPNNLNIEAVLPTDTVVATEVNATGTALSALFEEDKIEGVSDNNFLYSGGIIGRVSKGLTISNASYNGRIKNDESNYTGQIAEVNDGIIQNCKIRAFDSESTLNGYTGGLVGLNGLNGVVKADNTFVDKTSLVGNRVLGGYIGRNLANIKLCEIKDAEAGVYGEWGKWQNISDSKLSSMTVYSESVESAIGFLIGENYGEIDIRDSQIESSKISGSDYAGLYVGNNYGRIYDSKIMYDPSTTQARGDNTRESVGIEYVLDSKAKLSVTDVDSVGLITGKNVGEIEYIVLSSNTDTFKLSVNNGTNVGGIAGVNGDGINDGNIRYCFNYMDIDGGDNSGGIVGLADGKTVIHQCDNHADVSANTAAAGILGWSSDNVTADNNVTINDCVNAGIINTSGLSNKAGIAGKVGVGTIELCRNYADALNYGICASDDAGVTYSKNLEAGGLNEGIPNSDAEDAVLTNNPIAPVPEENRSEMVRNFYISGEWEGEPTEVCTGYYTEEYVGPGSDKHMSYDIDFSKNDAYDEKAQAYFKGGNIVTGATGLDVLDAFKNWYLGLNLNYQNVPGEQKISNENGEYIRALYKKLAGQDYTIGDALNPDFQNLLQGAFYIYYNHVGDDEETWGEIHYEYLLGIPYPAGAVADYDGLINLIRDIAGPVDKIGDPDYHENNVIPEKYGGGYTVYNDDYIVGVNDPTIKEVIQDPTSHWPKQLYYNTYNNGDSNTYQLVYHRWNGYYETPIGGFDSDLSGSDAEIKYLNIDSQFVSMVNNVDDYPNYDVYEDGSLVKQGFLPQLPEP